MAEKGRLDQIEKAEKSVAKGGEIYQGNFPERAKPTGFDCETNLCDGNFMMILQPLIIAIIKLKTVVFISVFTAFFFSCNEKMDIADKTTILSGQEFTVAKGETVSELSKSIWSIFHAKNNIYWFGSQDEGLYRYDGKKLIRYTTKDGLSHNKIFEIQEDKSGNLYLTTGNGINKFDGKRFIALKPIEAAQNNKQWKKEANDLWFQGANHTYRYDGINLYELNFPKTRLLEERIRTKSIEPSGVFSIYKDKTGNLWFGTSHLGVCRYDGKNFVWFTENGLAESAVRSIFEDKDGNMWFGNSGNGIYRYDGKQLVNFRKEKNIGNLNENNNDFPVSYMSIAEDNDGKLWFATYNTGVWKFDGSNAFHYSVKYKNTTATLKFMYKDKSGNLLFGTNEDGVYRFNGETFEKFTF